MTATIVSPGQRAAPHLVSPLLGARRGAAFAVPAGAAADRTAASV